MRAGGGAEGGGGEEGEGRVGGGRGGLRTEGWAVAGVRGGGG